LVNLSAADWLKENPPQRIWKYSNDYSNIAFRRGGLEIMRMDDFMVAVPGVPPQGGEPGAFMPMPFAGEMPAQPMAQYADYSKEISAGILAPSKRTSFSSFAQIKGPLLMVNLAAILAQPYGSTELQVYDLKGALIFSRNLADFAQQGFVAIPLNQITGQGGLSIIQIKSKVGTFRQKLVLPAQ
jgi:hypothetical protein